MNSVILHQAVGAIAIREENGFITALGWRSGKDRPEENRSGEDRKDGESPSHPLLQRAAGQLDEYFHGKRQVFDLPLEPQGTEFQKSVWGNPELWSPRPGVGNGATGGGNGGGKKSPSHSYSLSPGGGERRCAGRLFRRRRHFHQAQSAAPGGPFGVLDRGSGNSLFPTRISCSWIRRNRRWFWFP